MAKEVDQKQRLENLLKILQKREQTPEMKARIARVKKDLGVSE